MHSTLAGARAYMSDERPIFVHYGPSETPVSHVSQAPATEAASAGVGRRHCGAFAVQAASAIYFLHGGWVA